MICTFVHSTNCILSESYHFLRCLTQTLVNEWHSSILQYFEITSKIDINILQLLECIDNLLYTNIIYLNLLLIMNNFLSIVVYLLKALHCMIKIISKTFDVPSYFLINIIIQYLFFIDTSDDRDMDQRSENWLKRKTTSKKKCSFEIVSYHYHYHYNYHLFFISYGLCFRYVVYILFPSIKLVHHDKLDVLQRLKNHLQ